MTPSLHHLYPESLAHLAHAPTNGVDDGGMGKKPDLHVVRDSLQLPERERRAIGKRLKLTLDQVKLSQADAARAMQVTKAAVNNWVKGRNLPEAAQLYRLGTDYKVSVDYILFGRGTDPRMQGLAERLAKLTDAEREALRGLFTDDDDPPPMTAAG